MSALKNDQTPLTSAVVQLTGMDGNVFAILISVRHAILESDRPDLAEDFMKEAMAGDYQHVLMTCMRYVAPE